MRVAALLLLLVAVSPVYHSGVLASGYRFDGEEYLIDPGITYSFIPDYQWSPAVGFDGTNYLVVWQDHRNGYWDIYGARVTGEGQVLDPGGILICGAPGDQIYPAVGFDGTNYLVVWQDYRSGTRYDIYAVRVSPGGAVLDPAGVRIAQLADGRSSPAVGFDGVNYLVLWSEWQGASGYNIMARRVAPSGVVVDSVALTICSAVRGQGAPAVGFDGTNYLVVWEDCRQDTLFPDIYGARVSPGGTVLDSAGFPIATARYHQLTPGVAFDGSNYFVVWVDRRRTDTVPDIYGARVTTAGVVLDTNGIQITRESARYYQSSPGVAFDGSNYFVVWDDARNGHWDIYGSRVSPSGSVLEPNGIRISSAPENQNSPALGFDGTNFFIVWTDYRNRISDIYGARVTTAGVVLDTLGRAISVYANTQKEPAVGFDGVNYLVVWSDNRGGDEDIYGARVSQSGVVLDTEAIAIVRAPGAQTNPAIGFDGTNYLVVWEDRQQDTLYSDIYGIRVSPAGMVLDSSPWPITTVRYAQSNPVVGFDGDNYFVFWDDGRNRNQDIYGARVRPSGEVIDTAGIVIISGAGDQVQPAVAYDGTNYFVVWDDYRTGSKHEVYGARVTPAGAVVDSGGILIISAPGNQRFPVVDFDGVNYLVVWQDARNLQDNIYGARVQTTGVVLDTWGIPLSGYEGGQCLPVVAFDGTTHLVVWRYGSSSYDLWVAWVTRSGDVQERRMLVGGEGEQDAPALAVARNGQVFLVYQGWTDTFAGRGYRTRRIWGKMDIMTGQEEKGALSWWCLSGNGTVITRNVLMVPGAWGRKGMEPVLVDISGKKVMDLTPGANDISQLAAGVYFVTAPGGDFNGGAGMKSAPGRGHLVGRVVIVR